MVHFLPALPTLLLLLLSSVSAETFSSDAVGIVQLRRLEEQSRGLTNVNAHTIESGVQAKSDEVNQGNSSITGSKEEPKAEIRIVSPEFAIELSHSHGESANDEESSEAFDHFITQSFTELNGFLPPQEEATLFSSNLPAEYSAQTSKSNQGSPSKDEQRIPNLSDLRNMGIEELPLTFP